MSDIPPPPSDPADIKDWVESLDQDQVMALARQMVGGGFGALLNAAPRTNRIDLPAPPDEPSLFTVTIELRGSKPRIWRRLSLPGDLTLDAVHTLFQAAMGWSDSHLHRFQPGAAGGHDQAYFITEYDEEEGDQGIREEGVRLDQVLRAKGDRLTYLYDFGDGWEHRVKLESVSPLTADNREPRCLAGARACPPEDVGGIWGHQEVAAWLRAGAPADDVPPPFENAEHAHGWLPDGYDPDAFDVAEATQAMRVWAAGEHLPWHGLPDPLADLLQDLRGEGWMQADTWLEALGPRVPVEFDDDVFRLAAQPWQTILQAVGQGTKLTAAGHLPPVMVEELAQATGVGTWWIGKANREDLTWPIAELRESAQQVGLLRKAKGVLTPTARARAIRNHPRKLVAAVLGRLPRGKGFEEQSGWFALLGSAAGESGQALDAGVAQIMHSRGWRIEGSTTLDPWQARRGAQPTLGVLEWMAGGPRNHDPELVAKLARAVLFGVTEAG
jgi:hypothetical protein